MSGELHEVSTAIGALQEGVKSLHSGLEEAKKQQKVTSAQMAVIIEQTHNLPTLIKQVSDLVSLKNKALGVGAALSVFGAVVWSWVQSLFQTVRL